MSDSQDQVKLLRQLTQRKRPVKKPAAAAEEPKQKAPEPGQENPVIKYIKSKIPAALKKPKTKLAIDTLLFVGSIFVIVKGGKYLSETLEGYMPDEKDIIAQMKAEQEMMAQMQ